MSHVSLNLTADDERLYADAISRTRDAIIIDKLSGIVLYGPYLNLPAGNYEARIHLAPTHTRSGAVEMEVCAGCATTIIGSQRFDLGKLYSGRLFLPIKFSLARSVREFEVRLQSDGGASAAILSVEILHFEGSENLIDRWEATGVRALSLSQNLLACINVVDRIAAEFPIRRFDSSKAFVSKTLQYPELKRENLLGARVFADRSELISHLAAGSFPKIAEIGVANGDFSEFLINCLKPEEFHAFDLFGLEQLETVMGVDSKQTYKGKTHLEYYRGRLATAASGVYIHPGDSKLILPEVEPAQFDLVYVDAGHYYQDVKRDALNAARIVRPDGIMVFNDYMMFDHLAGEPYGVVRAVNELIVEEDWKVVAFALQHQMYCDIALARIAPKWIA
jgi:SAM-dependent methyltransferase